MTLFTRGLAENWRTYEKGAILLHYFHAAIFVVPEQVWNGWKNRMDEYEHENYCFS